MVSLLKSILSSFVRSSRRVSVRGKEVSQEPRLEADFPVERRQTEPPHAPPCTHCCHTEGSHKRALPSSRTGQGTGCCSLEDTGDSRLSHSGTQVSAGSCSQTIGWCTGCTETWRDDITVNIRCLQDGVWRKV